MNQNNFCDTNCFHQHSSLSAASILLENAGKRFNKEWIFRNLSYTFNSATSYAITGPNGSGKSTLLQVLAGSMSVNEGRCKCSTINGQYIAEENTYKYISIAAPYLQVVEEMTGREFLNFHARFKPLLQGITTSIILNTIELDKAAHKQIRFYSSGMKQRIKLAQAIFSDAPVLLLDEPCTNFDAAGYELYHHLLKNYCENKLVIVSSNDINEYDFCKKRLNVPDYK
jgi:ABC-type multidrug transport system ATPase subunit